MSMKPELPEQVIEAFHQMWGNFPEPASLVHKSFCVMAINKAHEKLGFIHPGMHCNKVGQPQDHAGCLARKAVAEKRTRYCFRRDDEQDQFGFWIPLDDYPDFFVHTGVGQFVDYKTMAEKPYVAASITRLVAQ